ncbi:MAG TPA: trehalose-phosphatase [Steroidobacteraceae bacterium]|jgi:trehalose 6-phosphate phosphatase
MMGESVSMQARGLRCERIPPPLNRIADHCALFLDFDGTLMNLEQRPDQVVVDGGLLYLLDELYVATAGATAVISGRGMEDLDAMLAPLRLPVAGIHGAQRRRADGAVEKFAVPATLIWQTRMALRLRLHRYTGLYVEDKGCAFAVHYRGVAAPVVARLRGDMEALAASSRGVFDVLEGAEVFELRPRTCDKGAAVESFMVEPPFAGRFPIFIGADQTDQAGFAAVARVHGMGIAVGPRVTAPWWLPDPAAVRAWLRGCLGLGN